MLPIVKLGEVCVPSKGRKPVLGGQSLFCIPVVIGGNICKFDKSAYVIGSEKRALIARVGDFLFSI